MEQKYTGPERREFHGCTHEKEFGEMQTNIKNLYYEITSLEEEIKSVKSANTTIVELGIHLKNLIEEVKEVVSLLKDYGLRIDALERAEGDSLKALRNKIKGDVWSSVIKSAVIGVIGFLIGQYISGGA